MICERAGHWGCARQPSITSHLFLPPLVCSAAFCPHTQAPPHLKNANITLPKAKLKLGGAVMRLT